jgi:hypothetical protein
MKQSAFLARGAGRAATVAGEAGKSQKHHDRNVVRGSR